MADTAGRGFVLEMKSHLIVYDNTINEALFLCAEMIGNEAEEDALLVEFYRQIRRGNPLLRMTEDTEKQVIAALLPAIHAHLMLRRGFGNDPPDESLVTGAGTDPEGMKKADGLIAEYYRERRAHFVPSPLRIRRLRRRITE